MKKEEIYVVIDSEQTRQRAIEILERAGEIIDYSNFEFSDILIVHSIDKDWFLTEEHFKKSKQEITLDQLEQLLNPKKEIKMELDALKLIAESYGFYLVEKPREIKVGDFGKFWDCPTTCPVYGYLQFISKGVYCYSPNSGSSYRNFAHLTEDEKEQLIKNL
jgi:hypothetical protein